jgi:hypothetical protein
MTGIVEKGPTSLSLAPEDRQWDAAAAKKNIKAWASDDDGKIDFVKHGKAFFSGTGDKQGNYKLPFADVIDDRLCAVWHGVSAAYEAVKGARGGTDDIDEDAVLSQIKTYYKKFDKDSPEKDLPLENVTTKNADPETPPATDPPAEPSTDPTAPAADPQIDPATPDPANGGAVVQKKQAPVRR